VHVDHWHAPLSCRRSDNDDPNDLAARGLHKPYFEVRYDFILVPHQAEDVRRRA
jgi:hypothetical protein